MIDGLGMRDSYGDDKSHYISDLMPLGGPYTSLYSFMGSCFHMIAIWECSPKGQIAYVGGTA